jgi:hypothetical protein
MGHNNHNSSYSNILRTISTLADISLIYCMDKRIHAMFQRINRMNRMKGYQPFGYRCQFLVPKDEHSAIPETSNRFISKQLTTFRENYLIMMKNSDTIPTLFVSLTGQADINKKLCWHLRKESSRLCELKFHFVRSLLLAGLRQHQIRSQSKAEQHLFRSFMLKWTTKGSQLGFLPFFQKKLLKVLQNNNNTK